MCSVTSIAVQCMCLGRYGDCTSAVCSLGDGGHPEHGSPEGKSGSGKNETLVRMLLCNDLWSWMCVC